MKIVMGEWFRIPRVGPDVFKRLVSEVGLIYDKYSGFKATSETDLVLLISVLRIALKEDVEVIIKCFICGAPVNCGKCRYNRV